VPKHGNIDWTPEFVKGELNEMNERLKAEEKAKKINIIFFKELILDKEYSYHSWVVRTQKYKEEDWFINVWEKIKERLHIRLLKLGLSDSRKTGMVIWLDKTQYGTREPEGNQEQINVKLEVKEIQ
jgi:hypothetical protein